MKHPISLLLFLLSVFFVTSCHPRGVRSRLSSAYELMDLRPDSALFLLQALTAEDLPTRRLRARHALLLSQALDKNYIDLRSDSVIAPAVAYYSRHGSARDRAYTDYYLSVIRSNAGDPDAAVRALVSAEGYALRASDRSLLARIYGSLGRLYQLQHSLPEADTMYGRAERLFRAAGDTANVGYMLMNRAMVHTLRRSPSQARACYRRALAVFRRLGDTQQEALLLRCLADVSREEASVPTDTLRRQLAESYALASQREIPAGDYALWSDIHLREHRFDSARHYALRALETEPVATKRCGLLLTMASVEERCGNYRLSAGYWRRAYRLFDSIAAQERRQSVQAAEKRYRNQELRHTNELLRMRNRYTHIGWGVAVVLCLSLAGAAFLRTMRRYRQFIGTLHDSYDSFRKRYLQLRREADKGSEEELRLLQVLEARLKGFQRLLDTVYNPVRPQSFVEEFKRYAQSIGDRNSVFTDLQYVVNRRYCGLVDYLRREHPSLTDRELDMLCMLRFGFSFNCIRLLHHHENIYSLYSRRTKIHRKLGLPPHYRIEDYLRETAERLAAGQSACTSDGTLNR